MLSSRISGFICFTLLVVFIYFSQFFRLDDFTFRIFDEVRLALSAFEMLKTGNYLIPTVEYEPDMWSTKPPMMIWMQAVSMKIFGLNEFAVRFPAALCAAICIVLVCFFVSKITGNYWAGLAAGIILSTAQGYIGEHGTRFGEYDSALALFTTSYIISFFLFIQSVGRKANYYLSAFFLFLTLASLTKGVAGLLFLPAVFLYTLFNKKILSLLCNKVFYAGAFFAVVLVLGYYLLREHYNDGYIQAVFNNELGGRYNEVKEEHAGAWNYFLKEISGRRFGSWFWFIPLAIVLMPFVYKVSARKALNYIMLCAVVFLAVISSSATKPFWYALPLYPLFAIIGGIVFHQLSLLFAFFFRKIHPDFLLVCLIVIFSVQPVYEMFSRVLLREEFGVRFEKDFYRVSYYLRDVANAEKLNNTVLLSSGYNFQWKIYVFFLQEKGISIRNEYYSEMNEFNKDDKVLTQQADAKDYLQNHYQFKLLDEQDNVWLAQIIAEK